MNAAFASQAFRNLSVAEPLVDEECSQLCSWTSHQTSRVAVAGNQVNGQKAFHNLCLFKEEALQKNGACYSIERP